MLIRRGAHMFYEKAGIQTHKQEVSKSGTGRARARARAVAYDAYKPDEGLLIRSNQQRSRTENFMLGCLLQTIIIARSYAADAEYHFDAVKRHLMRRNLGCRKL